MAILEKIRHQAVLLFTIIIIALLAFILGDFLTSGRTFFGNGTTIAKVAGHTIDVQTFQKRLEIANNQVQNAGQDIDSDDLRQQVLTEMLYEALMDDELNALGIVVTDNELSQIMLSDPQMAQMYDAVRNPVKYGLDPNAAAQLKANWKEQEQDSIQQRCLKKFGMLFDGVITANKIDAQSIYDDINTTFHITFARQYLSSLPDADYPVSDAEIQAEWKKEKARYRIENEQRTIDYIVVNMDPSAEDNAAAEKEVEDALMALQNTNETEAVDGNINFNVERSTQTKSQIANDVQLKNFVDSVSEGTAGLVSKLGNTYTLAKVIGIGKDVDSLNVSIVSVADSIACDSVVNALMTGGAKITDFELSQDSLWWLPLNPNFPKELTSRFLSAEVGKVFSFDTTAYGTQFYTIYRVNKRNAPVTTYDLAKITYVVEPSTTTENKITANLRQFITDNNTAEAMATNAAKAGYTLKPDKVRALSSHIGELPESSSAVKWAMNAKKGQVSDIFSNRDNSRLLVVAVKDIYNDNYIPATDPDLKTELTTIVRNDKKAAALLNKYKDDNAKSVEDYATLMDVSVDTTDVTFLGQQVIKNFGLSDNRLVAQVAAAEATPNILIGPIRTNDAIVAFTVTLVDKQGRPYNYNEYADRFNNIFGNNVLASNIHIFNILRGRNKVESHLLDF